MPVRSLALLVTLAALWGGSFAFMRVAVPVLGPVPLAFARVTLAATVLLAIMWVKRQGPDLRARWRGFAVVGLVNSALPFVLFCFAEQFITASAAAVLNATSPFFGAIAATIWLGEALTVRQVAGMLTGLVGVAVLVAWHSGSMDADVLLAIAACLAASLCYGLGGVYIKHSMRDVSALGLACGSQAMAALWLAPALPFTAPLAPVTLLVALNVVALAVASTALAYLIYFRLIAEIGPSRALTVTFLIPLFGVLWGFLFLDEALTANMVAGGTLIVAGTMIALRR